MPSLARIERLRLERSQSPADPSSAARIAQLEAENRELREENARWKLILESAGLSQRLRLPHVAFNRKVGAFAGIEAAPDGTLLSPEEWAAGVGRWLPTAVDKTHVLSLMQPVHERGKIAAWIAPPRQGINGKPFDYDYVHLV